ncbi:MAG: SDR family oxidoreductase [Marinosulfonomonas sp.]|nr:SDR family oxidoreductase [Marinosulfonomonas sp.]
MAENGTTGDQPLAGKVAIVTGAGNGIGREVALHLASSGASVVANDFGVAIDGEGSDPAPANAVVAEIIARGGQAIANTGSVAEPETADAMVAQAIDNFGRIDIVVNNAGIFRLSPFDEMPFKIWDHVVKVHLYGSFLVARAAAPHFRAQKSGAFVHMSSTAGLIGSLGHANYAAAKMGIIGLSKAIALDMRPYGVRSNCIAPSARNRLTDIVDEQRRSSFSEMAKKPPLRTRQGVPEQIAPMVTYLASDQASEISGQIFGVRGNEIYLYSQPRPIRTLHRSDGWTVDSLSQIDQAWRSSFTPLETLQEVFNWDTVN